MLDIKKRDLDYEIEFWDNVHVKNTKYKIKRNKSRLDKSKFKKVDKKTNKTWEQNKMYLDQDDSDIIWKQQMDKYNNQEDDNHSCYCDFCFPVRDIYQTPEQFEEMKQNIDLFFGQCLCQAQKEMGQDFFDEYYDLALEGEYHFLFDDITETSLEYYNYYDFKKH